MATVPGWMSANTPEELIARRRLLLARTPAASVAAPPTEDGTRPVNRSGIITPAGPERRPMPAQAQGWLTGLLAAADNTPEVRRLGTGDMNDPYRHYIHVSSLLDPCPRQHVLASLDGKTVLNRANGGMRVLWAMGRAAENHVRTQFLAATDNRLAYGRWVCQCERSEHTGLYPSTVCRTCGQKLKHYKEITLYDHDNQIKGNPDLLAYLDNRFLMPVEVKSKTGADFKKLEAAQPDHLTQVGLYEHLLLSNKYQTLGMVRVFYVNRQAGYDNPYKEFALKTSDTVLRANVGLALDKAKLIKRSIETRSVPARLAACQRHDTPSQKPARVS